MTDGLYRVTTPYLCAGFVVEGGEVVACAPILRKRIDHWRTVAERVTVTSPLVVVDFSNFVNTCWFPAKSAEEKGKAALERWQFAHAADEPEPKQYDAKQVLRTNLALKLHSIEETIGIKAGSWVMAKDSSARWKYQLFPEYKANREKRDYDPRPDAEAWLREHVDCEFAVAPGNEADDCIAAIAAKYSPERLIIIVSGDKDLWQLLSERVKVLNILSLKYVTTADIEKAFKVTSPSHIRLCKALWGDSSDNIPNVVPRMQKDLLPLIKAGDGDLLKLLASVNGNVGERCWNLVNANIEGVARNWKLVGLNPTVEVQWERN